MKILIKQFQENGFVPETTVRTQRSRNITKDEKSLIFGISAKVDHMKNVGNLKF